MGKMKSLALELKEQVENEWEVEQRALLRSQGYTQEEVDVIIDDMVNEYNYEMAMEHGVWE
jgi:hypothetical protein|tara:strand:- start:495 stop:677 length:183 start_codon:yes stop_codon:yes gene_type:complete